MTRREAGSYISQAIPLEVEGEDKVSTKLQIKFLKDVFLHSLTNSCKKTESWV